MKEKKKKLNLKVNRINVLDVKEASQINGGAEKKSKKCTGGTAYCTDNPVTVMTCSPS